MSTLSVARTTRRIFLILAALLLVAILSIALWLYSNRDNFGLHFGGGAAMLLDQLAEDAGLSSGAQGPVKVVGPDGPMPEMASRAYRIEATDATIRQSLSRACQINGLSSPSAPLLALEPDMLCEGHWRGESVSVHLSLSCSDHCTAFLEVRSILF